MSNKKSPPTGLPRPTATVVGTYTSPEGVAAGLARISRSTRPIAELVADAIDQSDAARRSNERIIYEYGHSSIAEGAVFGVAIENIPRSLSIDVVAHRLASYTQLSYRYVTVGAAPIPFYIPEEWRAGPARTIVDHALATARDTYDRLQTGLAVHLVATGAAATTLQAERLATEDARYAMPLLQMTQLGMTTNARTWGQVIGRLRGHETTEGRLLGDALHTALQPLAPSLFPDKYLGASTYPASGYASVRAVADRLPRPIGDWTHGDWLPIRDGVKLVAHDPDGERHLAAHLLASARGCSLAEAQVASAAATRRDIDDMIRAAYTGMGAHDRVPRAFETVSYTVEIAQSEACYHQLIRHRMTTQTAQDRPVDLSYEIPPMIEEAGLTSIYRTGMGVLEDAYADLIRVMGRDERTARLAGRILGNGHRRRTMLHINAREAIELTRLRADKHAQWEVRRVADALHALISDVHPIIGLACGGRDVFKSGALPLTSAIEVDE